MRVRVLIENLDECKPVAAWDLDLQELAEQCTEHAEKVRSTTRGAMAFLGVIDDLEKDIGKTLMDLAPREGKKG